MIPVKSTNTKTSPIVVMGNRLRKAAKESGEEYLLLNRGVNMVVPIELNALVKAIDFNADAIQVYPGTKGKKPLIQAINKHYFDNKTADDNILVTAGGISGLDIALQNLALEEVLLPPLFWGTYGQLLSLREKEYSSYASYEALKNMEEVKNKAVIICDPGNPTGEKYDDEKLLELVGTLNSKGAVVLFDSPYRRLFYDETDDLYQKLLAFENVVIVESFSKSLGLSGQRIGFLHSSDTEFITEATRRFLYATNGVNGFAQELIAMLLGTEKGLKIANDFKQTTAEHIRKNIQFLKDKDLLAAELYQESEPLGIFTVLNVSPEKLFGHRIGSVGLDYFTLDNNPKWKDLARICVSIPHEKFVRYFEAL
jgi:aspartate/methionine/tyrosine aminotransferase